LEDSSHVYNLVSVTSTKNNTTFIQFFVVDPGALSFRKC